MAIEVECPICGEEYKLPPKAAGRSFRCKSCDESISVPGGRRRKRQPTGGDSAKLPPKRSRERDPLPPKRTSRTERREQSLEERIASRNDVDGELVGEAVGHLFRGLFLIAIGVVGYLAFAAMETEGEGGRVPIILLLIYNLGGKWLVAALFGGAGLFFIGVGIVNFVESRR